MSTVARPSSSMNRAASAAMPTMLLEAVPVVAATPALSNRMTSRPGAQRVADRGVEVVEFAHEVLGEDDRGGGGVPEASVGEAGIAHVEELCWRCGGGGGGGGHGLLCSSAVAAGVAGCA